MKRCLTLASLLCILFSFSQTSRIDSLTVKLAYQKQDSAKVETALYLVKTLFANGDYKKALVYIDQTENLAKQLNYKKGIADIFYYKALIYSTKNDYYNAVDSFSKALSQYRDLNDTIGIAKVNNRIGLLEIKRGNFESGLRNSSSAISVFEKNNLPVELSSAYNNLAEAYLKTNQIDRALEYNLKALRVNTDLRDTLGIINSSKNLGNIYAKRREHRQAINYYEKLLRLSETSGNQDLEGAVLPKLGYEYLQLNNFEKASVFLVKGLKLNRRLKNDEGVLRALNAVGKLNLNKGNTNLARIQANEANVIAKRINDKEQLLDNYRLQKEIDSIKRNYQNAFFWQGEYFKLKEELEKENKAKRLPIIGNTENIQIALEEETVEPNRKLKPTNQAEKDETNLILSIFGGGLLIAIVVIVLLLLNRDKNTGKFKVKKDKPKFKQSKEREQLIEQNSAYEERIENLEEVNRIKDRLFSIVSHDLKDSVSSIKAFIDLIKQGNISKKEFYNLIPELSENADSAMELLFNLLNWSKSQMQSLEPKPESFNIQDIFHNKLSLVEQKAEQKNIELINNSQRDLIHADKSMIEIVVQNLLTNAVKFTRSGDRITVSNSNNYGKALISVADTGVGISQKNIDKIFKDGDFTTNGTSNEKGTGLGLTICKQLVELNNGKIWVESQIGEGTTFYVELPKMKAK